MPKRTSRRELVRYLAAGAILAVPVAGVILAIKGIPEATVLGFGTLTVISIGSSAAILASPRIERRKQREKGPGRTKKGPSATAQEAPDQRVSAPQANAREDNSREPRKPIDPGSVRFRSNPAAPMYGSETGDTMPPPGFSGGIYRREFKS